MPPRIRTLEWIPNQPDCPLPGFLRLVDQTRLPETLAFCDVKDPPALWQAIRSLQVRGAPAIGVAAAIGILLGIQHLTGTSVAALVAAVNETARYLATSRPTAVNLFWALDRMRQTAERLAVIESDPKALALALAREALAIQAEDVAMCQAIGRHGVRLLDGVQAVLTHCNAGSLATAWYGTALAPLYVAQDEGRTLSVFVDETRPLLQGARLTAWELQQSGFPVTVLCDNMAAWLMRQGRVGAVLVGADRIAANGDTANKIGTYGLALLAAAHRIPFYVLAPTSTFDLSLPDGSAIPIETRSEDEVTTWGGRRTAPHGVAAFNPAFDVTPASLITAIVCEKGIARPPTEAALRAFAAP